MDKFKINQVDQSELEQLRALCIQTFRETYDPVKDPEQFQAYIDKAFTEDQLRSELVRSASEYYFLRDGQKEIGYLMLNVDDAQTEPKETHYLEIQRIYLLNEYKGQGLGTRLIDFTVERARTLGKSKIWLGVWEENEKAIQFYRSVNFFIAGEHTFMMGDIPERDWIMEKEVK